MSIIKEIKNSSEFIKKLLIKYPDLRDSDYKLISTIWKYEAGGASVLKNVSAKDFLDLIAKGRLTNSESIRRSRQKIQRENPSLRGENYGKRKKESKNFKGQINK